MSSLTVYHQSSAELPNKMLNHAEDISSTLAAVGVRFTRLQAGVPVSAGASKEELLAACREPLDALMQEQGYSSLDLFSLCDEQALHPEARAPLRSEQRYDVAHLWWCVAGRGVLHLHIGEYVYAVLCEKHDLLLLPAGTAHWFDIGEHPRVALIRLFDSPQLPGAQLTGQAIAETFAGLDDY